MTEQSIQPKAAFRLASAIIATASLSACATAPTGAGPSLLVAGAPSSHVGQSYETNTSTANVASSIAGVQILYSNPTTSGIYSAVLARGTGTINHQTGALNYNDSIINFNDPNGATSAGVIADTAQGATGEMYGNGAYQYVSTLKLAYAKAGQNYIVSGYVGPVTAAADMPDGGSATYSGTGTADFVIYDGSGLSMLGNASGGNSTVSVDFSAGTASVDMANFYRHTDATGTPYAAGASPFDQVQGTGLVVSGSEISGGTWVFKKNNGVVTYLGAHPLVTSEGAFFGYEPSISAPAEVAGVVLIKNGTLIGAGTYYAH